MTCLGQIDLRWSTEAVKMGRVKGSAPSFLVGWHSFSVLGDDGLRSVGLGVEYASRLW